MILVCGEALYDMFAEGAGMNGAMQFKALPGGSPFNVARGIARLEGKSAFFSGIGNDVFGDNLRQLLEESRVTTRFLMSKALPTSLVTVGQDAGGQPAYSFRVNHTADAVLGMYDIPPRGGGYDAVHIASYSLVMPPMADAMSAIVQRDCVKGGLFLSMDPNVRPTIEPDMQVWRNRVEDYVAKCQFVKTSREDLSYLYPDRPVRDIANEWRELGVNLLIVTAGEKGAAAWWQGGAVAVPSDPLDVVDTVGAGDAFQAACLTWLQKQDMLSADKLDELSASQVKALLTFGNKAAALACLEKGCYLPTSYMLPKIPS